MLRGASSISAARTNSRPVLTSGSRRGTRTSTPRTMTGSRWIHKQRSR